MQNVDEYLKDSCHSLEDLKRIILERKLDKNSEEVVNCKNKILAKLLSENPTDETYQKFLLFFCENIDDFQQLLNSNQIDLKDERVKIRQRILLVSFITT